MESTFLPMLNGIIIIDVGMLVINLIFFIYGKIKKADMSPFGLLWAFIVSLFSFFFTMMLNNKDAVMEVKNGLSGEVILFIFLSLFTLVGYALTLGTVDSAMIRKESDSRVYLIVRNVVNGIIGIGITALGIYITNMDGKYKDENGRIVLSHTGEVKFAAIIMLTIGVLTIVSTIKRSLLHLGIDEADRMLGRGKAPSGEWQPGVTIPVYDKIIRYEMITMIFSVLTSFIVLGMFLAFLIFFVRTVLFILPAGLVVIMILGLTGTAAYQKPKYLRNYQFEWTYGKIVSQETKAERNTTRFNGEIRTTIVYHNLVTFDFGQTLEVDAESYRTYSQGREVFIIMINKKNEGTITDDLQSQMSSYDGKCQLYG